MTERSIFLSAIEISDPGQRAAYVAEACGEDAALREQVDALLQSHDQTSQFLETPAAAGVASEMTLIDQSGENREEDDDSRLSTGEAEFRKFLQPSTRPGWLGRLAHYEIEQILGRGAFGIVAKALDEKLHRVVAIKMLSPEMAATSPPRKRFAREARTAAQVRHENIVGIYAVEEEPIPYIVMEYVPGQTLTQRLDEHGPLEVADVVSIGQQIAAGLAASHAVNLIHRDIKPSNILLETGPVGRVKISDFGLARAADDASLTTSGLIAGTPMYMAPEQARGETLDHRADLFSLGSVMYQMVSGRPPFRAANTIAVLKRVCEDTPRPITDVIPGTPDWLCTIISRLLEKKREDRFQTAQEVAELLARCQSELKLNGRVTCVAAAPSTVAAGQAAVPGSDASAANDSTPTFSPARVLSFVASGILFLLIAQGIIGWGVELTGWSTRALRGLVAGGAALTMLTGWIAESLATRRRSEKWSQVWSGIAASACLLAAANSLMIWIKKEQPVATPTPAASHVAAAAGSNQAGWHGWPADAPKPAIAPFDAAQAKKHQEEWAAYLKVPVEYTNSIGMKFRLIPPGEFTMGSTPEEIAAALKVAQSDSHWADCIRSEAPQHRVILSRPFYLGVTEVTQSQYETVMGSNPSFFCKTGKWKPPVKWVGDQDTSNYPVENVNWIQANEFCAKLVQRDERMRSTLPPSGENPQSETELYRLPTESEWDFACRAGSSTRYWTGDTDEDLLRAGWFGKNSAQRTHAVGELEANPFGLVDVHGNVWEWVKDAWDSQSYAQYSEAVVNPDFQLPSTAQRALRGGDHGYPAFNCRSSNRGALAPWKKDAATGFRAALEISAVRSDIELQGSSAKNRSSWHGWPEDAPKPAIAPFDAAQAKKHQEEWAAYLKVPVEYTNSIGMKFRLIPPGEFLMGSTVEEITSALKADSKNKNWQDCIKSEAPQHKVVLTHPTYLGVNEVTQAEYEKIMGSNPSYFAPTGKGKEEARGLTTSDHPVETVSWNDAAEFCAKLSQQEKLKAFYFRAGETITPLDGTGYRLPSEAEWEFACRAGTTTKFWIGDKDEDLVQAGWYGGSSGGRPHASGELKANPFGLSDIHGNVWEWVQDGWDATYYGQFQDNLAINPGNPFSADSLKVLRGGRWGLTASYCRSSGRYARDPTHRDSDIGFRVSLTVDAVRQALKPQQSEIVAKTGWQGWPADAPKPAIAPFDAVQAKKHQEEWAAYLKVPVEYTNSIGMKFRLIPPGEFLMGSTPDEIAAALKDVGDDKHWKDCINSEGPQHKVILTQPIYLGVNEVTQAEYEKIMGSNPSHFAPAGKGKEEARGLDTADHPVEMVSWNDAAEYCVKLSQQEKLKPFYFRAGETTTPLDGTGYRLPSEAEWEFACRAGTTTKFWISDKDEDLVQAGWFAGNSGGRTHATGELKANPFGLADIHGNVWEWVQDGWEATYYAQFKENAVINPGSPFYAGPHRVFRGGGLDGIASVCRSSDRFARDSHQKLYVVGFRVSLPANAVKAALAERTIQPVAKTGWHGWPPDAPQPAIAPFPATQARKHQQEWADYLKLPVEYTNSVGMKFRLIPPGEFMMGSTEKEISDALPIAGDDLLWQDCIKSEGPQHKVILTRPIYLGVHEVTQSQYQQITGTNPSHFSATGEWAEYVLGIDTSSLPVEGVSWAKAADFCQRLIEKEKLPATKHDNPSAASSFFDAAYRLPSEAEWEFASRAGTATQFFTGYGTEDLNQAGWWNDTSGKRTHVVGELQSNAFGLYDMHGNVWEWALDAWNPTWYATLSSRPAVNPFNPPVQGSERMTRGGNYSSGMFACRSASRCSEASSYSATRIGFRVVISVDAVKRDLKSDRNP